MKGRVKKELSVKTGESWSAQCFSTEVETLSGPTAFLLFCFLKSFFTADSSTIKGGGSGVAGSGGEAVTGVVF